MRYLALIFAAFTALAVWPVLFPRRMAAWVSPEEILAAILFWPVLITSIGLIWYGARHSAFRSFSIYTSIVMLSAVFPVTFFGGMAVRTVGKEIYLAEQKRREKWYRYDDILIPHIVEYVRRNPDKVSFPFSDDRARITGLVSHLHSLLPDIPYRSDSIIDPWGDAVTVVIDHDNDMQLRFLNAFYGVYNRAGNDLVVALYCDRMHSLDSGCNEQWQMDGGWIKKP